MRHLRKTAAFAALMACCAVHPQSDDQNYALSYTYIKEQPVSGYDNPFDPSVRKAVTDVQYYDGLGRPSVTVTGGKNASGSYVYSMQAYDNLGRPSETWLPVGVGAQPSYIAPETLKSHVGGFYQDNSAFSRTTYDALGRVVSVTTEGDAWGSAGKMKRRRYMTNDANSVKLYTAPMDKISLVKSGYYEQGMLDGEYYEDEDGHTLEIYKDFMGHTVLERRNGDNDTYYVYNDIGQLRYVLSPSYQEAGYKDKYAYEYRYDSRGRMVKKILPGCEYTQYWYDAADRIAFMQDATLREHGLYRFYLYDRFGRQVMQGLCSSCRRDGAVNTCYYLKSGTGFDGTGYRITDEGQIADYFIEAVNYYDDYDYLRLYSSEFPAHIDSMRVDGACNASTFMTGMLYTADANRMLKAFYYDLRGRTTDVRDISLGGRFTAVHTDYTFTGKVEREDKREYAFVDDRLKPVLRSVVTNNYDSRTDLLTSTDLTLSPAGAPSTTKRISAKTYDGIGRVVSDGRPGGAGSVTYGYDLHGWPTSVKGTGFAQELHYADGAGEPCYNGSLSSMQWTAPDYAAKRGYKYAYDGLNRLVSAEYGEKDDMLDNPNRYDEKVLEYTADGMIERFQRRGKKDDGIYGKIDNITIRLDGNRIKSVDEDALPANKYSSFGFEDGADDYVEYTYNGVGALTSDGNKGIESVTYDYMNHPAVVTFAGGDKRITYMYTVGGEKLQAVYETVRSLRPDGPDGPISPPYTIRRTVDYNGNTVYKDGKPHMYLFDGGYVSFEGGNNTPAFHFYTRDHQGNIRAVVAESGTVEQINHYYPFGGVYGDACVNPELQPYKYNGKEFDRMHGLDWYDYGARMYDPVLASWTGMDPLCEKYYNVSPYAYCKDNPVNRIDIDGMDDYYTVNGYFLFRDDKKTDNIIIRSMIMNNVKKSTGIEWMSTLDTPLANTTLSAEAYSNIFTHILSQMPGVDVGELHNGKVSVTVWDAVNTNLGIESSNYYNDSNFYDDTLADMVGNVMTAYIYPDKDRRGIFSTLSNVQNILGHHEYWGHFKFGWSETTGTHHKVFEYQMRQQSWKKTTHFYKEHIYYLYDEVLKREY